MSLPSAFPYDMESENNHSSGLQETQSTNGTSFRTTCFNTANTLCDVGVLTVPYALSMGGWLGLSLLLLVALLCWYTGIMLHKCMNTDSSIKTYPDIGERAFGRKGRMMISTLLYVELFLVAVEFLILEADNLHKLFPKENFTTFGNKLPAEKVFTLIAALVVLPTTWFRNLGVLAYVSASGVISSIILMMAVLWGATLDGIGFHERGVLWNWHGSPTAISLFTFCYLGHAVFPTIRNSMEKKTQFPKVLFVCILLCTIIYALMSIIGYLMFGEHVASQVTLNLPTKHLSSKIAIWSTIIIPVTKYAIIISPIAIMMEDKFPFQESTLRSCVIRTSLVITTLFVALTIPFFGHVMAFSGAFVGVMLSIVFPSLCYWKIVIGFRNFRGETILIIAIVLIGTVVAVIGTCTAVINIIKDV